MKILYGVQGTGNGHISRARLMAQAFALRSDVQVDFLFSGRAPEDYFDMQVFADYQCREGITFSTSKGAVQRWQTFRNLKLGQFYKDVTSLDLSEYELVINDFEPVTAWAAKRSGTPSISVSHQAAFLHPFPLHEGGRLDKWITRYFAPTQYQLGVHWYHFGHNIMPPFIANKPRGKATSKHLLVYLPFEDIGDIRLMLEPLSECNFVCFHPAIKADYQDEHMSWRRPSKTDFDHCLQHCAGVIANGGFELSSECLQLGKKLLVKPLLGQYEQLSNSLILSELGLCSTMHELDSEQVDQWLLRPQGEAIEFPGDPNMLIDWLLAKQWHNTQSICDALWQQVKFPQSVQLKLAVLSPSVS
jgi:uncharacterized protein (TIGR00661 family)